MNAHTLRALEYHKLTNIVSGYAASEPGRAVIQALLPARDISTAQALLQETGEFTRILQIGETPPLGGIPDVGAVIGKLNVRATMLAPLELLSTAQMLAAGRRVKSFFQHFEAKATSSRPAAPVLCSKAARIPLLKHVEDAVTSAIDEKAEVKDSASPELRKIRKQLARMREDILSRMNGILQDSGFQKIIQESVITIRDDRYVLPLKPNFRQGLQGVVHGQSGSRSTLFVEPLAVLEQNNRLAELRMEEQEETERILRELSSVLAQEAEGIVTTREVLADIDAIYARARFGIEYDGSVPAITNDGSIKLRAARHPLLVEKTKNLGSARTVTPNTIELSEQQRALIISGPNAGGKTVVLKTMGLLALMAQSGIPVTAGEGSELPCFSSMFADIGDEQSLEQDLSTFSSHISQIAEIIRTAEKSSLVLLDELGAGTDPGEGAALAAAVLERLIASGAVTFVTTHHNALKLFGSQTDGALNAAMEFDLQTLKPTYRLMTGRPGRSYGLDMASRFGLPEEVVQKARARIGEDDTRLDDLLKQVEIETSLLISERDKLKELLTSAEKDRADAATRLKEAHEEARSIKSKAKQETRDTVATIRQRLRDLSREAVRDRSELKATATEIESLAAKLNPAERVVQVAAGQTHEYRRGERARMLSVNKIGTVLSFERGMVELELGNKTIKLSAHEIEPVDAVSRKDKVSATPGWGAELTEHEAAPDRLHLLGFRVEEGLAELDRFIDRARIDGLRYVTIIHGLGTGALKKAVIDFLKNHPLVAGIRPGEAAEGGAGVTIAELKK